MSGKRHASGNLDAQPWPLCMYDGDGRRQTLYFKLQAARARDHMTESRGLCSVGSETYLASLSPSAPGMFAHMTYLIKSVTVDTATLSVDASSASQKRRMFLTLPLVFHPLILIHHNAA